MKSLEPSRRATVDAQICAATSEFVASESERARFDPLKWEDFGRLDPDLVTIGSHTLTHPILPTLDDATLEYELRNSRDLLEQRLGRTVDLFCFPNGSADARVFTATKRVYGAAVTAAPGNVVTGTDVLALPRIPVAAELPLLAWRMHRPRA